MAIQVQTVKKQAFLRQFAEVAKANSSTLRETLIAAQTAVNSPTFQKGRIVISQSGSGQSGSFVHFQGQEWTQDNIFGLIEEFIQLLDYTVAQGTPDAADADLINALLAAMFDNMNAGFIPQIGIRQQMGDFSGLNFPANSLR